MSLDDRVVDLMRDQFATLTSKIDGVHEIVREHVDEDRRYWQKIDEQQGQMSLLKTVCGASGFSALVAWVYSILKH